MQRVPALSAELNKALGRLPCIHGFTATAELEVVDGVITPTISFRCYECKQTWSFPPGMQALIDNILAKHTS